MKSVLTKTWMLSVCCLLGACTNRMYVAERDVTNSLGEPQKSILYWPATEPLLGESKAGPIVLMTACSTRRLQFDDSATGIVWRADPSDQVVYPPESSGKAADVDTACGRIETTSAIAELGAGPLAVSIFCQATGDEFAVRAGGYKPEYIRASETPYAFDVREGDSRWSLFGTTLPAPEPPACR